MRDHPERHRRGSANVEAIRDRPRPPTSRHGCCAVSPPRRSAAQRARENIDGKDIGRVAFVRCLPNGCVAEVVLDDALLKTLSEGKNAIFVVFKTPEEGVGIPVSLNGFGEGFAQLP